MAEANILWFRDIRKEDIPRVGGKGANLGEMTAANFPVPPGFAVTAQAYFNYLRETGLRRKIVAMIDSIDVENTERLNRVSAEVRELIKHTLMSDALANEIKRAYVQLGEKKLAWLTSSEDCYVAVRSSATAEDLPSISENEHVLLKVNGAPVYGRIGSVFEKLSGMENCDIEVPAMKGNRVEWLKARSVFRHKASHRKLFRITTKSGREIVVSPNHSLIALDEKTLEPKTIAVSEVDAKTKLPVSAHIPELNCREVAVNVRDFVSGNDVVEENGMVMVKNRSSNWRIQHGLPAKIEVSADFAYFLGHYLAEGSTYKNNVVSITNSNRGILGKIEEVWRKLGIYEKSKINKFSIRCYCPALVRLLHETCGRPLPGKKGKGKLCGTKRVPDFVFGWGKGNIAAFLRGCFDGDGTVSSGCVSYCTTSEMLAGGIVKLLEILGIGIYLRRRGNALDITIPRSETPKFAELVGFGDGCKRKRLGLELQKYAALGKHPEFKYGIEVPEELAEKAMAAIGEKLPKQCIGVAVCKECGEKAEPTSYYKKKKRYYCRRCGRAFYEEEVEKRKTEQYAWFDEKGRFRKGAVPWNYGHMQGKHTLNELGKKAKRYGLENFFSILEGTVRWDTIREVVPVEYDGWVYDFEVPEVENFAAGLGGIITHNSASFAGQQETYLNVKGKDEIVRAVQNCWASLFTARAVYYRKKQGFATDKVGIAVIVQKMVESKVAGVMFTASPTGDESKIVIEAAFGLGEAVVSGSVTPDTYVVDKGSTKLIEKRIATQEFRILRKGRENIREPLPAGLAKKQKLPDKDIIDLAKIGKQIELHYKMPQDIEWAIEEKEIYMVQSRAITTLKLKQTAEDKARMEEQVKKFEDRIILRGLAASPGIVSGKVKVIPSIEDIAKVQAGDIIVTKMTSPDWVPTMKKAKAIITDEGGSTCHAAIISRELGIPCVVGTEEATKILEDNDDVTINGFDGFVYKGKVELKAPKTKEIAIIEKRDIDKIEKVLAEELAAPLPKKKEHEAEWSEEEQKEEAEGEAELLERAEEAREEIVEKGREEAKEIVEKYGGVKAEQMKEKELEKEERELVKLLEEIAVKVKVNVALPEAADAAAATKADGVGLLRAEHMITASGMHPAEFIRQGKSDELKEAVKKGIRTVAEKFRGKPVWYRTFDARTDEFRELEGGSKEPHEDNPMIGWHGVRRDLDEPELLKAQFLAVKELVEEGFDNIGIMLPFVQSIEELRQAKEIARECGLEPGSGKVEFGMMVETPAAVWGIDEFIDEGIDFISFGTNDLTQLTLGIDRGNERIQKWFTELHPAVLRSVHHVIEKCKKAGVKTSICGQAGSDPEMVKHLVRFGIDSVSANIDAVKKIKKIVLIEEKKLILEERKKKA